jgi:hypothetical protein
LGVKTLFFFKIYEIFLEKSPLAPARPRTPSEFLAGGGQILKILRARARGPNLIILAGAGGRGGQILKILGARAGAGAKSRKSCGCGRAKKWKSLLFSKKLLLPLSTLEQKSSFQLLERFRRFYLKGRKIY